MDMADSAYPLAQHHRPGCCVVNEHSQRSDSTFKEELDDCMNKQSIDGTADGSVVFRFGTRKGNQTLGPAGRINQLPIHKKC